MTTATPEQINTALATWLGWQPATSTLRYKDKDGAYVDYMTVEGGSIPYFDPYHRIDHAWLLVEHVQQIGTYTQKTAFNYWFCVKSNVQTYRAEDAARMICEAIVEICEVAV